MCPVCTVTVVAGLGISRLLGIDDLITSIWIGAFILSLSFVTINWIEKSKFKYKSKWLNYFVFVLMYLLTLIPLSYTKVIGITHNTLWGIDKIVLGIIIGSVVFLLGVGADKLQRKKFKKIFFPFQKVILPVLALLVTSVIFWLATKK